MIHQDPPSRRGPLPILLLFCLWACAGYGIFVGCICIWVGFGHAHESGYGVPILAGGLTIGAVLCLALPAGRALLNMIRRKRGEEDLGSY